jgi:hypothetical protein
MTGGRQFLSGQRLVVGTCYNTSGADMELPPNRMRLVTRVHQAALASPRHGDPP